MRGLLVVVVVVWSEEKEGKRELSGGMGGLNSSFFWNCAPLRKVRAWLLFEVGQVLKIQRKY